MLMIWTLAILTCTTLVTTVSSTDESHSTEKAKLINLLESLLQKDVSTREPPQVVGTYGGTAAGAPCRFPFIHEGKLIYSCFCKYDIKPWCATTENFDAERSWGYCKPTKLNIAFGGDSTAPCSMPFKYGGLMHTSCQCYSKDTYPWCSTTEVYRGKFRFCAMTACPADYCKNGGTCKVDERFDYKAHGMAPFFRCTCKPGYLGPRCEKEECGVPAVDIDTRIIGGTNAKAHSWPWMVGMVYSPIGIFNRPRMSYHKCGGALIAHKWVLTAAHCIDWYNKEARAGNRDYNPTHYLVMVGDHSHDAEEKGQKAIQVREIYVHEDWDLINMNNDIALLELTEPVKYSTSISPICLPSKKAPDNSKCYATGWGRTEGGIRPDPKKKAPSLQQVLLKLLPQNQCRGLNNENEKHVHCFQNPDSEKHKGVCRGDSGGPINCKIGKLWELVGVASFVTDRNCLMGQSYFTEVYDYVDWITNTIKTA